MDKYYIQFFGYNIFPVCMWGKLYRLSAIAEAKLSPSGYKRSEDLFFNLRLFPNLKKVAVIEHYGYYYRTGGSTSKYNPTLYSDYVVMNKLKFDEAKSYNYPKAYHYLAAELRNYFVIQLRHDVEYNRYDKSQALELIESRLDDDYLHNIMAQDYAPSEPIDKAIRENDVDFIYQHITKRNKKSINACVGNILTRAFNLFN